MAVMDDAFDAEHAKIKDDAEYQRDGTLRRVRTYVFFLGKHGPFTEKVDLENFDPQEIHRRVDALRAELRTLPR